MSARRGACPGLADPMPTGDGLLARFAVTRAVPLDAFAALCAAAQAHGNGIIEITSRGSIQVRGLTPETAPAFTAAVDALGIADPADGRVMGSPLAGLDPDETTDVSAMADELRAALIETGLAAALAPKVSIVVDGGGALHLRAIPADLRLRAEAARDGVRFHLALAGDEARATPLGTVAAEHAVETAVQLLQTVAARGRDARARVGVRGSPAYQIVQDPPHPPIREHARGPATSPHGGEVKRASRTSEPIGTHLLRDDSTALGLGLPFGHSDAITLERLIDEARSAGALSVRPAPGRALLVIGVARARAHSLAAAAERLGFIVNPTDPRRRIVACAGAPVCAAGQIPTRALAPAIATTAEPLLDQQTTIHLSGCAKGCAHSGPATVTIVGLDGRCGIVPAGTAQDDPLESVGIAELPTRIAALLREAAHG